MMHSHVDRESVIAAIELAWLDARQPEKYNILPSNIIGDEEQMGVKRDFEGKSWRDLDAKFIDQSPDGFASALCFMSNEALRYYISAYLIADLKDQLKQAEPDFRLTDGMDAAAYGCSPSVGNDAIARWRNLDDGKVHAIVKYLEYKRSKNDGWADQIEASLDSYWYPRSRQIK
jgi:hypothetical protein